jgi:hypothetical protein
VARVAPAAGPAVSISCRTVKDGAPVAAHAHWDEVRCVVHFRGDADDADTRVAAVDGCAPVRVATRAAAAHRLAHFDRPRAAAAADDEDAQAGVRSLMERDAPLTWKWNPAASLWEPCLPITNPCASLFVPVIAVVALFVLLFLVAVCADNYLRARGATRGRRPPGSTQEDPS